MFLNCHTYFSFRYGTLSPEELFLEAHRHGVHKLVLADINNTSAWIDMQRICLENQDKHHLEVALGITFCRDGRWLYTGIARSNAGFEELNRFLSGHNNRQEALPDTAPHFSDAYVIYPWHARRPSDLRENEYAGIRYQDLNRLLRSPYAERQDKLVIWQPVVVNSKAGHNVHRLLRAIDQNTLLSKLDNSLGAQRHDCMLPPAQLQQYFARFPQIISNTVSILNQCRFEADFRSNKNKAVFSASRQEDRQLLASLAREGFGRRYPQADSYTQERLARELEVINERDFGSYFLITWDMLQYARHHNYAYVGRGSGANSMVAYCLGITDVDPIELDLYFERFLNPYRASPPDFDIDFSWKDRDAINKYLFDRYGTEHTALLGTQITFQGKSILRELCKVFGLPKAEIDAIVEQPHAYANRDEITRLIFKYAARMMQLPNNLSIHAGGVVITDQPIYAYTATDLPPKGFPTTHFEMHAAEDVGIYKFDILSQRGLGHIKDSAELVARNQHIKVDTGRFRAFKKDEKIKDLLRRGKTMGCFYVESPAMRMLLGKLQCEDYLTLVAASSIIRPGVARSGMMREYIHRHHHPQDFVAVHPRMEELMRETYGVMVYQEDVLKVAHHFAGLDLGEADVLRRGMSGKFRSRKEFQKVHRKFFENCAARGYSEEITKEVWRQIESFSGYSFSKAHSASYAVESYQSLYLKAHYPLEFMVGVINNFGGFYKTEFYFHEARMDGASVEAPCVNRSHNLTDIEGKTIYMGFIHLKSLEGKVGQRIPQERLAHGPYRSLDDFMQRVPVKLEQLRILIRIGAFRFTGRGKRELLWEAYLYFGKKHKQDPGLRLFETPGLRNYQLPALEHNPQEDAFDELELLGFPLCDPFLLLASPDRGDTRALELRSKLKKQVHILGYLVTIKYTHTKNKKVMHFATFYDPDGQVFDTTHFPQISSRYPFRGKGFYRIKGTVVEDFGYPMVEVSYMEKLPMIAKEEASGEGAPVTFRRGKRPKKAPA